MRGRSVALLVVITLAIGTLLVPAVSIAQSSVQAVQQVLVTNTKDQPIPVLPRAKSWHVRESISAQDGTCGTNCHHQNDVMDYIVPAARVLAVTDIGAHVRVPVVHSAGGFHRVALEVWRDGNLVADRIYPLTTSGQRHVGAQPEIVATAGDTVRVILEWSGLPQTQQVVVSVSGELRYEANVSGVLPVPQLDTTGSGTRTVTP